MKELIVQSQDISGIDRFFEDRECLLRDVHEGECRINGIICCVDIEDPPDICPLREGAIKISLKCLTSEHPS